MSAAAHRLRRHHLVDALLVLLCQDGQLSCLLVFERLEDDLVLGLGGHLHLVVPQRLVLLGLHLACILELLLNLQLHHLQDGGATEIETVRQGSRGDMGGIGSGVVGTVEHLAVLVAVDIRSEVTAKWQNNISQVSFIFIHYTLLASLLIYLK